MPRLSLPYAVQDLSALARSIRDQIVKLDRSPTHLELLNMLARAAGRRNYQHYQAEMASQARLVEPAPESAPPDHARIEKALRHFDAKGRLLRWPSKANLQELCLWALWSRIPAGRVFSEREISDLLTLWHLFGDHALLRRALFEAKLVDRTSDVREYRRIERKPPPELPILLDQIAIRTDA